MATGVEVHTAGGGSGVVEGRPVRVGRHSGADVVVDDMRVSREHLVLEETGSGWVVRDPGSGNGTFLGGERVGELVLAPGSETVLRLGDPQEGPWVRIVVAARSAEPAGRVQGGTVVIGRDTRCDVVVDDLLASRRHAEMRTRPDGRHELVDLGSYNGTYVNGRLIEGGAVLADRDLVGVGRSSLTYRDGTLVVAAADGAVDFAALGVTVTVPKGPTLVHDVGFALEAGSLLAVVGPSGAGKSTLLGALAGLREPTTGTVLFGGLDLYGTDVDVRSRIGFVPQDDLVHPELTVAQSIAYEAELRFPPDVSAAERNRRVREVMEELGLTARADVRVARLSGGQRKRVSVALEVLTRPSLLFLDEPTSGLDPGLERTMMELFRELADSGRTVIVVTHSVDSLNLADRVLCLAPGGHPAFFGPPQLTTSWFGLDDYQQVFRHLSTVEVVAARKRFLDDELGERFLTGPLTAYSHSPRGSERNVVVRRQRWGRQLSMLVRRYARVLRGDPMSLVILFGAAPALGLFIMWRLPAGELSGIGEGELRIISSASLAWFMPVIAMTQIGISGSIREIVKERPIFVRERAVGLSLSAYVVSKLLVLGAATVVQACLLIPLALLRQDGPPDAVLLGSPMLELIVAGVATGIAAVALGLAVSAAVNSTNTALALLPTIVVIQTLLGSAGVFPAGTDKPVLREMSYAASAQWGFSAGASTIELNELQAFIGLARELRSIDVADPLPSLEAIADPDTGEPRWNHDPGTWLTSIAALGVIAASFAVVAGVLLRRFDPV
ncbi:MAG: ATP-binding cassette domain-containing protein [Acidimicrobiales bacterium]